MVRYLHIIFFSICYITAFAQDVTVKKKVVGGIMREVAMVTEVTDSVEAALLPQLDDTISVRIANSYDTAQLGVKLEWFGFTYGTGLDQSTQEANMDALEAAWEFAANNNYYVSMSADSCEAYMTIGQTITIPNNKTLKVKGAGSAETALTFYPLVKTYNAGVYIITTCQENASLDIEGISLYTEPFRIESYEATFVVSGDSTQIEVTDSDVRAAFFTDIVGQTIYTSSGYTQAQGYSATVLSVVGTTITLTGNINYPPDQTGKIAFPFASNTPLDTLRQYGEFWYGDDTGTRFLALTTAGASNDSTYWHFEDVKFAGFDDAIENSGGQQTIEFINCDLSADQIFLGFFNGTIPGRKIYMLNSDLHGIGKEVQGYLPNSTIGTDQIYGAGIYSHDNITHEFVNCNIYENIASSVRQRSSSGTDVTAAYQVSKYVNCEFWDNSEYHIFTSRTMPSLFVNTGFRNGNINLMWESYLDNCVIDSCLVSTAGSSPVSPRISIQGGEIKNSSRLNFPGATRVYLENIVIEPHPSLATIGIAGVQDFRIENSIIQNNIASTATAFFSEVLPLRAIIDNCYLGNLNNTLYFYRTAYDFSYSPDTLWTLKDVIKVTDSQVYGKLWDASQLSRSDAGDVKNTFFNNQVAAYPYEWDDFTPRSGVNYNIVTATNASYGSFFSGTALTWQIDPNYNFHYVQDSVTRACVFNSTVASRQFTGEFTLVVQGSAEVQAYDAGTNTASNFMFSGTYTDGQVLKVRYDPRKILAAGTTSVTTDTITTASGVATTFANWQGIDSNKIVPGTVSITVGAVTLTDDNMGNLTGSGGYGYVDYETQMVYLVYDSAPTGAIIASYDEYTTVHQRGVWYLIND